MNHAVAGSHFEKQLNTVDSMLAVFSLYLKTSDGTHRLSPQFCCHFRLDRSTAGELFSSVFFFSNASNNLLALSSGLLLHH